MAHVIDLLCSLALDTAIVNTSSAGSMQVYKRHKRRRRTSGESGESGEDAKAERTLGEATYGSQMTKRTSGEIGVQIT